MKTSNIHTTHSMAIIRGWVDPLSANGAGGSDGSVVDVDVQNGGAVDLIAGDVVALQSDGSVAPVTTVGYAGKVGVVNDDIAIGEYGAIVWAGPVDLVNVTASVTAGNYGETSATAKKAQDTGSALPDVGSFVRFTSSGTTPSGYLVGSGAGGGSVNQGGDTMPYLIPAGETFTVPANRQGLYTHAIQVDGAIIVDGILLFVE